MMKMKPKIIIAVCASIAILVLGIGLGSTYISPVDIFKIILHKVFGAELPADISATTVAILWSVRFPRSLLAFIVGGALSVSGAVMQSVLRNPLASSYTLGVSSGASLGAGIIILYKITVPFTGALTLPAVGFVFGLGTILLVIAFASRIDSSTGSNTIILTGMVFSLFANAMITLLSALAREQMQRLIFWQMGSFSGKDLPTVGILAPVVAVGIIVIMRYHRELDIMTFGEEQSKAIGVNLKWVSRVLLISAAALTGSAIAFVGIIGFVDLIAPHIVRKLYGSSHRFVVPMSALFGGSFMVLCDLVARTVVAPQDLPVGAVTAIIGAPFFAYIYFSKRSKA